MKRDKVIQGILFAIAALLWIAICFWLELKMMEFKLWLIGK